MKQLDVYGYKPLQHKTWLGLICTIITFLVVICFGFLQVMTLLPRLTEPMGGNYI